MNTDRIFTYHSFWDRKEKQTKVPYFDFGLEKAVPPTTNAAWGARALAEEEKLYRGRYGEHTTPAKLTILPDRKGFSWISPAAKHKLQQLLDDGILQKIQDKYLELYDAGEIFKCEQLQHVLYEDDQVKAVGDTLASYGYLYIAAWLKP